MTVVAELAVETVLSIAGRILGLATLSGGVAALSALAYRWYGREPIPEGVAVLAGLASIALWMNTTATLAGAIGGNEALQEPSAALFTVAAFVAGGIAADLGRRAGDRVGVDVAALTGGVSGPLDGEMSTLVRSAGRVIRVTLPEEIEDVDGYDPIPSDRKREIAGTTLLFPRRLTVAELRDRLAARLEDDYGAGYVDVEVTADGTVEHLALGRRPAGVGRTLPSGTVAVAVRADPAFSASPGDAVEVWRPGPDAERVARAELRAAVGDVATLVVDEDDADALDPDAEHRLVTLSREPRADRQLLSALQYADETPAVVRVEPDGRLVDASIADLEVTVVAIDGESGLEAAPRPGRRLAADEVLHVIGRPDRLRELGATAGDGREAEATS